MCLAEQGIASVDHLLPTKEMETIIKIESGCCPLSILCPFCGTINEEHDNYICDDYVSLLGGREAVYEYQGMLWCKKCNALAVTDPFTEPKKVSRKAVEEKYPEFASEDDQDVDDSDQDGGGGGDEVSENYDGYVKIQLAWVKKVVDQELLGFVSDRELTASELKWSYNSLTEWNPRKAKKRAVIKLLGLKLMYTEERLKEHGSQMVDESVTGEEDNGKIHPKYLNLACRVDSYNVRTPQTPYPERMILARALPEVYTYFRCTSATGEDFDYVMWGD